VAALVLAGCSFGGAAGPESSTTDTDAAADSVDGAVDAPEPVWTVVDTLTVDTASPDPTFSLITLEDGVEYRLRVSGTITNVIDQGGVPN
jgi:PBP1b-binding outer membrane lipoprotein LpoB